MPELQLKTASGEQLLVQDFVCTQVQLDQLKVKHNFVVVDSLVVPVILGVDFLQKNGLALDTRLSGSTIFRTLEMRSGYWQMLVHPRDQEKTAFCPGPGMGLYQFKRMPFGLAGAPSSFQRSMDKIFRDLLFVTCYLDNVLVHSGDVRLHGKDLKEVFHRLREARIYWPVGGTILGPYFLSQGNVSRRQESASSARLASAS